MSGYPNIYSSVVFDLHPKVRGFIDQLNLDGQIDLDSAGYPYLIACDRVGTNIQTRISRNNRVETFVLNPRKKADPLCSWNANDGFVRDAQKHTVVVQRPQNETPGTSRERKKVTQATIESIVETILGK